MLLRTHMSCVQHSDTITYHYYLWRATNRAALFWVSPGSVALPNRSFNTCHWSFICLIEFSIVTHCDAELIPREPFFDVPWIHTLPPEEYLDTQWTVHEHEFTLTIVMQLLPFNLSFPRICIRLLPRHLSTSLLFSALLALLCSALHSYTQLHSYTATYSYTAIQLHSYTAIQPHSYTDRQTDRQNRQTETNGQFEDSPVNTSTAKCMT